MYKYVTASGATQVYTPAVASNSAFTGIKHVRITVNTALTGTIAVIDGTTGTTANVATITNPTVGSFYDYWDLQNGVRVNLSTTCDITVNVDASGVHQS